MTKETALSTALKELESDDIIVREQFEEISPRVEYSLTAKGEKLMPIFYEMARWGLQYIECGDALRGANSMNEKITYTIAAAGEIDSYSKNPYAIRLYDTLGYAVVGHADWRKGRFDLREKKL